MRKPDRSLLLVACAALSFSLPALAGRPLTVDDADVNDPGSGHVEAWYARQPGHAPTWTLAPAYAPVEGLELGAAVARDTSAPATTYSLQAKWRITPVRESGCNVGAVLGLSRTRGLSGDTPYANGLLTCRSAFGATHLNLGALRGPGGPTLGAWGVAHEWALGRFGVHVEAFGQRHANPTFQAGLRTQLTPALQIDGSLGRSQRETLFSVGLKTDF